MNCTVCNSENLEGAAYCEDCGSKLAVVQTTPAPSSVSPVSVSRPAPAVAVPMPSAPSATVTILCGSCGATNLDTEAYCVDCSANLGDEAPAPPASASPPAVAPLVAASLPPGARLVLHDGTKEFSVDRDVTSIGRRSPADQIDPDIDLTDDDPDAYVSRRHAKVMRVDSGFLYEDVGSSNGSWINDTRAQAGVQHPMQHGDKVRIGKTEFIFHGQ